MEENFKKIIEQLKENEMDPEVIKEYILVIKRVIRKVYENCKDEESKEEIITGYLEEYEKDLKFRGNAIDICNKTMMYNSYSKILQNYRGNKANFDATIREAKKRELENNKETIYISKTSKECMVSAIRDILRNKKTIKEKEILQGVQEYKNILDTDLREKLIHIIHSSIKFLDEYGFIDEYIELSNNNLVELGLPQLQYEKRNPIADEQYDKKGNLVTDVEEIGVIDVFEKENLDKLSIEDLEMMAAVFETRYYDERMNLSRTMSVVKTLNLWDVMLEANDEEIKKIPNKRIESALKKDLALTYLCRNNSEITGKMRRQYKKFLKKEDIDTEVDLETELKEVLPEMENLNKAAIDIGALDRLILHQLKEKDIKPKKWGIAAEIQENEDGPVELLIAVENKNFRGPVIISVFKEEAEKLLGKDFKFPKYEKELNIKYLQVMSKLYIPITKYFTNLISKAYEENPGSEFIASLAGKKVRQVGDER